MTDSYEFARLKKRILKTSEVEPPRISDVELDGEFVRFEVPAQEDWLGEHDSLSAVPPAETQTMVVGPVSTVVTWYERLLEEVLDDEHLHVDVLDLDGERTLEVRCKREWAVERMNGERTEASFVKLLVQTLGPAGANDDRDDPTSPWYEVDEVPKDLQIDGGG